MKILKNAALLAAATGVLCAYQTPPPPAVPAATNDDVAVAPAPPPPVLGAAAAAAAPLPPVAVKEADAAEMLLVAQAPPAPPAAPAPQPAAAPRPPAPPRDPYARGAYWLDRRGWEQAIKAFDEVIASGKTKTDGALYWKSYALAKLGRQSEALMQLAQLEAKHPQSRWLNDAKALALDIKQSGGKRVDPDSVDDEDLKLIAISGLMSRNPDRALPMLEKIVKGNQPPRVKERAIFVLAQSSDPRARALVAELAKGGNPDVQAKAVEFLALTGAAQNGQTLAEIYRTTNDPSIRRSVLRGYMMSGQKARLLEAARSEADRELRREAIHMLGIANGQAELADLYSVEKDATLRRDIVQGLMMGGASDRLADIARTEKDATVRRAAIQGLAVSGGPKAAETLATMYGSESDRDTKKQIIQALTIRGQATPLVEIARKESDPVLKREIVRSLAMMNSKEADEFLGDVLK